MLLGTNAIKFDTDGESLICACGNTPMDDGFFPATSDGIEVEPEPDKWDGATYICGKCKLVEKVYTP